MGVVTRVARTTVAVEVVGTCDDGALGSWSTVVAVGGTNLFESSSQYVVSRGWCSVYVWVQNIR